jgi:hypothetical protein
MPHPKRRACVKCVQAKRKCDLALPQCERCDEKGINCVYEGPLSPALRTNSPVPFVATTTISQQSIWAPVPTDVSSEQDHLAMNAMSVDNIDTTTNWLPDTENVPFMDFDDFVTRSPVPTQVEEFNVDNMEGFKSRVRYAISRMKGWPAMFAQKGTTPFIHHSLSSRHGSKGGRSGDDGDGRAEDIMLDALSACALYTSRNAENGRAAMQNVRRKAKALTTMMVSETYHSPVEVLAFLQALSLYQIVRLFDGDIELRTEAEADSVLQDHWTDELMKYSTPLTTQDTTASAASSEKSPVVTNPKDWRRWIFEESVRRVVIVSIMIQQNYAFLKRTVVQCTHSDNICFTAQKALWEAPSAYHWGVVWTEKPHQEACPSNWDFVMETLRLQEPDEISVILVAMMSGLDSAAQWLGKEHLMRYGLDWNSMCKYLI